VEDVTRAGRVRAWGLAFGWATLIWVASSVSSPRLPSLGRLPVDKLLHAAIFGALCWLVLRAITVGAKRTLGAAATAVAIAGAYGWVDELHQRFVPGRDSSMGDVAADVLGATVVAGIAYIFRPA